MENKVDCMSGIMQHWLAFMSKNIQRRISLLKWNQLFMILWASTKPCLTCFLKLYLLSDWTVLVCSFRTTLVKVKLTVMRMVIWMMTCKATTGRTKLNTCTNTWLYGWWILSTTWCACIPRQIPTELPLSNRFIFQLLVMTPKKFPGWDGLPYPQYKWRHCWPYICTTEPNKCKGIWDTLPAHILDKYFSYWSRAI
jgi:hypothetical protein